MGYGTVIKLRVFAPLRHVGGGNIYRLFWACICVCLEQTEHLLTVGYFRTPTPIQELLVNEEIVRT